MFTWSMVVCSCCQYNTVIGATIFFFVCTCQSYYCMCRANEMLAIRKLNEWKDDDEEEEEAENGCVVCMHMSFFSLCS